MQDELRRQTVAMAHGLNVVGLMNVQFAIQDERHASTCSRSIRARRAPCPTCRRRPAGRSPRSPRAAWSGRRSRRRASRARSCRRTSRSRKRCSRSSSSRGVDTILGPEMKSTGEVMGVGETFAEAFVKTQLAAGVKLPASGQGLHQRARTPTSRARSRSRSMLAGLGFDARRDARHGGRARRRRRAGDAGQQGARRPAAHRRHDEERRDRARRQHRARRSARRSRTATRSGARR